MFVGTSFSGVPRPHGRAARALPPVIAMFASNATGVEPPGLC